MPSEYDCEAMNQRINDVRGHVRVISDKFDKHHEILTTHIQHFNNHELEELTRHDQFIKSQALNTKAINDLTTSVSGIVEVYSTASSIGKFVKWMSSIAIGIGLIVAYFK